MLGIQGKRSRSNDRKRPQATASAAKAILIPIDPVYNKPNRKDHIKVEIRKCQNERWLGATGL